MINFETGSIKKHLQEININYSTYSQKTVFEIEEEIKNKQETIEWNEEYINLLKQNLISFDKPSWNNEEIEIDISEDLRLIIRKISDLILPDNVSDKDLYDLSFSELNSVLKSNGYNSPEKISNKLIEIYTEGNTKLTQGIKEFQEKINLSIQITSLPEITDCDKVLKYETTLQRSIYQNLIMLKKLQSNT